MNKIEQLKQNRIDLSTFIRITESFDGKYWNRLSQDNRNTIENAYVTCANGGLSFQFRDYSGNMDAPKVTIKNAVALLGSVEQDIHLFDTLSTCPIIEEWAKLIEKLADISQELREKGMHQAPFDAKRLGIVRGTVNWG